MIFPKVIKKYKVRSFKKKDVFYIVEQWNNGDFVCECPAYSYNYKISCKHIELVKKHLWKQKNQN